MDGNINGRTLTDSAETVQKHTEIVLKQLTAHSITIPHVRTDNNLVAQNGKVN